MRLENSKESVDFLKEIFERKIKSDENKIRIDTNLRGGMPIENINKVAGPLLEKWAQQMIQEEVDDDDTNLLQMDEGARLDFYDILISVDELNQGRPIYIDVKSTAEDIESSGRSPNITSYAKIREQLIEDEDTLFLILDLVFEHKRIEEGDNMVDIFEVIEFSLFDLVRVSDSDLNYNPALGTGQLQIRNIRDVDSVDRNVEDFIELLDEAYVNSHDEEAFKEIAEKRGWNVN